MLNQDYFIYYWIKLFIKQAVSSPLQQISLLSSYIMHFSILLVDNYVNLILYLKGIKFRGFRGFFEQIREN